MHEADAAPVQVWTAHPGDLAGCALAGLGGLLDDAERGRAARFRHGADRSAYVAAHALRRMALAHSLSVHPRDIAFSEAPGGRPVLADPRGDGLFFSHSHTRDRVACAVTRAGPVGIDVETVNAAHADWELISRFVVLTDEDRCRARDGDRVSRFYFYWTALEAFWKAQGRGLADGNPRIECRENPRGEFEVQLEGGDSNASGARLFRIESAPECCIAVAVLAVAPVGVVRADAATQLFNGNMQLCNSRTPPEMLSAR